jgi:hypothetical protein
METLTEPSDSPPKKKRGPARKPNRMVDTHIHMPEDLLEWCKRQPEGFAGLVRMLCTLEKHRRSLQP